MRAYADSSFILRLVTDELDSPQAIAEYRRLGSPGLFFLPLHALEVRNAVLQRAFHQRRSNSSRERAHIAREKDVALARIEHLISRRALLDVTVDWEAAVTLASKISREHTERIGARAIDVLHVACALALESELFLTCDTRQSKLAKAKGLKVAAIG